MTHSHNMTHDCDQLLEILENAADAIISVDSAFRITHFNPSSERLFGYMSDEIIGQSINVLLPMDHRGGHDRLMQGFSDGRDKARMMGERRSVEGLSKSGRRIPLDISILKHKSGGRRSFTAIARDISEQVESEQQLRESERRFRAMFHGSYQFTGIIDTKGCLTDINDTARNFVGDMRDAYRLLPVWDLPWWVDDLSRARWKSAIRNAVRGRFDRTVVKAKGEKGRTLQVDLSVKPIFKRDGEVAFLVAEGRDITDLMHTNEALAKSESRLAHAQRIASLGNWEWDLTTNGLLWSDEVYRIFGLTPNTFGASFDAFLEIVHPEDRHLVAEAVQRAVEKGQPYVLTHRILTLGGEEKIVEERGEVLRNEAGEALSMSGTVQDVTEAWRREHELSVARDHAETASRSKSQFLATMSHELRTPLNAIIGFSELIEAQASGTDHAEQHGKYARYIHESGQHLLKIINDILDVSRADVDAIKAEQRHFDPVAVIEAVFAMVKGKAEEKGLILNLVAEREPRDILMDERLCRQILINLVVNAIKFTPSDGQVDIGFVINERDIEFVVRDTGQGIALKDLEHVFEPFFQVEGEYARRHDGVGLGLTIVKRFTEIQGGAISVKSTVGKGTEFRIQFPDVVHMHGEEKACGCCGPGRQIDMDRDPLPAGGKVLLD
jgi:PAS domain S-box-containing protein